MLYCPCIKSRINLNILNILLPARTSKDVCTLQRENSCTKYTCVALVKRLRVWKSRTTDYFIVHWLTDWLTKNVESQYVTGDILFKMFRWALFISPGASCCHSFLESTISHSGQGSHIFYCATSHWMLINLRQKTIVQRGFPVYSCIFSTKWTQTILASRLTEVVLLWKSKLVQLCRWGKGKWMIYLTNQVSYSLSAGAGYANIGGGASDM